MPTNYLEPVVPVSVERYNELIKAETVLDAMCVALNEVKEAESYMIKERLTSLLTMFGRLAE